MIQLDNQVIIDTSEDKLLSLCNIIFNVRDLASVEEEIWAASKIRLGLKALNQTVEYTSVDAQQRILLGLNSIAAVYNQQVIPNLSI